MRGSTKDRGGWRGGVRAESRESGGGGSGGGLAGLLSASMVLLEFVILMGFGGLLT